MKKLRTYAFPAAALALFAALTLWAGDAAQAAREGLTLSLRTAVPALFPFFVAGALLTHSGLAALIGRALAHPVWMLYGLNGNCAAALVLGLAGGYPVGAQTACELYRAALISKRDAELLLGFCNNSGPAFILGVAGVAVCGSARTGAALYAIHALAALLTGLVLTPPPSKGMRPPAPTPATRAAVSPTAALVAAVRDGFGIAINVTAFVTFFSVTLALLRRTGLLRVFAHVLSPVLALLGAPVGTADALTAGTIELTNGLAALPTLMLPPHVLLPLVSFLLGFGGLSVHCQTLSLLQSCGLSARRHTIGKILHGIISAALAVIWCRTAPASLPVFAPAAPPSTIAAFMPGLVILGVIVIRLLRKGSGKARSNPL